MVCTLVIGFYAWQANSGVLELMGSGARDSYYNLLVQAFREGHLNLERQVPAGYGDPPDMVWDGNYGLDDLSYYKGKLYLYFGVTPALLLFWPYAALTGHYLLHKDAAVIFFSAGFLAGAGLLWAVWRRYFKEIGFWVVATGTLALGLGNFAPAILEQCDVYEVAVSCGYALTMVALCGIWRALHDGQHRWRWLAASSLAYGLALGARPSLLLGAVILLAPVSQGWREKGRVWPLLAAACGPIVLIGFGLMIYNAMRFDNPLEFGQRYQLPLVAHEQFNLRYLWYDIRVGFLQPARWGGHFPYVDNIAAPEQPKGYCQLVDPFGVLTNIPLVWLALAAPAAWRVREEEGRRVLRMFLWAVALLFGMCALPMVFHDSMCLRYELEYASPLVLLAAVGVLGVERALAGLPAWRRAARCGWGLLLAFTLAFNLFASYKLNADDHENFGSALLKTGRLDEAIAQFQKTVQLRPYGQAAHNNLGKALVLAGRVDEAILQFQEALQTGPNNALVQDNLGNALLQKGRVDEAIIAFEKVLQLETNSVQARNNLGNALVQKGRVDEGIIQYRQVLLVNPNVSEAHNNLGNALLQEGKLDEAISEYQLALQINPGYAHAQGNLGTVLLQKGRMDEGIAHLQKALQLDPEDEKTSLDLGKAFVQEGAVAQAIPLYQKALELKPADPAIQSVLAWLLATAPEPSLRDGRKAVELAWQANQETGLENPTILHILGAAYAEAGRFPEAVEAAQHALRLAEAKSNTMQAGTLQSELKLYRAGSPFHSPEQKQQSHQPDGK
jgi:tetratricopeptide (TPR) repeat protein